MTICFSLPAVRFSLTMYTHFAAWFMKASMPYTFWLKTCFYSFTDIPHCACYMHGTLPTVISLQTQAQVCTQVCDIRWERRTEWKSRDVRLCCVPPTHVCVNIIIYIYCVCVCVCMRNCNTFVFLFNVNAWHQLHVVKAYAVCASLCAGNFPQLSCCFSNAISDICLLLYFM